MELEILNIQQMYEADRLALNYVSSSYKLMQNAADAVVATIQPAINNNTGILILCGHGNNGGDGLLVAAQLEVRGFATRVLFCGSESQWLQLGGDARLAADTYLQQSAGISFLNDVDRFRLNDFFDKNGSEQLTSLLVVDAIFGAGLSRDVVEPVRSLIFSLNQRRNQSGLDPNNSNQEGLPLTVVSIDLPSGINGDTGAIHGIALQADITVSFFRKKPAHFLQPGKDYCGDLVIADIGIPASVLSDIKTDTHANTPALWLNELVFPHATSHKYTCDHTLIASGPRYKTGAARLAASAALRAGSGALTLASPSDAMDINAAHCTEVMLCEVESAEAFSQLIQEKRISSAVIGPGFGQPCAGLALYFRLLRGLYFRQHT